MLTCLVIFQSLLCVFTDHPELSSATDNLADLLAQYSNSELLVLGDFNLILMLMTQACTDVLKVHITIKMQDSLFYVPEISP